MEWFFLVLNAEWAVSSHQTKDNEGQKTPNFDSEGKLREKQPTRPKDSQSSPMNLE